MSDTRAFAARTDEVLVVSERHDDVPGLVHDGPKMTMPPRGIKKQMGWLR